MGASQHRAALLRVFYETKNSGFPLPRVFSEPAATTWYPGVRHGEAVGEGDIELNDMAAVIGFQFWYKPKQPQGQYEDTIKRRIRSVWLIY
jgi:hypothetical protein